MAKPNMSQQHQQHYQGDYHRPRRPSSDTISYLRSLPLELSVATTEIEAFLSTTNTDDDFPVTLAAALQALYEIRHELASLAGDEHSAAVIERLLHIALPHSLTAARVVLQAIQTYALHLATHRYGSHVLQTVLELLAREKCSSSKGDYDDLALHEQAPELPEDDESSFPSLSELVANLVEELRPAARDLAVHICGSHVLRSLLCVLGGVGMVHSNKNKYNNAQQHQQQPHRGKVKNKKRKKSGTDESASNSNDQVAIVYLERPAPIETEISLQQLTDELTGFAATAPKDGPGTLQRWACHSSAGPVLIVLLHVLTYRDYDSAHSNNREQLTKRQERWRKANATSPDRHLGLACGRPEAVYTENSDAHVAVQRILCWDGSVASAKQQKHAPDVIYGLAGEPRGSHVLESILRLSPDSVYSDIVQAGGLLDDPSSTTTLQEYVQDDVSNFVVQTMLATLRTPAQAAAAVAALDPLSQIILDASKKRRGIFWRLTELATSQIGKECQEGVVQMIGKGLLNDKTESNSWAYWIPRLLNIQRNEDGSRVTLDVQGTRSLYHLFRFEATLSKPVVDGFLNLPPEDLESLARDALGGRCTIDAILEGDGFIFADARARLRKKLHGRWVSLAIDRVGHHAVMKLFQRLPDMKEKEALVKELVDGKSRMQGNNMGRSVLDTLEVRAYESCGVAEWTNLIKEKQEKQAWLKEIVESDGDGDGDGADDKQQHQQQHVGDRKRQKRSNKKTKKKKEQTFSAVDVIFDAISIPSNKEQNNVE